MVHSIGTVVGPDQDTYSKSRGNVAKINVEMACLNQKKTVYDGEWLKIEYKDAPTYCHYFKFKGHEEKQCRNKEIDNAAKKRIKEAIEKKTRVTVVTTRVIEVNRRKSSRMNNGNIINELDTSKPQNNKIDIVLGKGKQKADESKNHQEYHEVGNNNIMNNSSLEQEEVRSEHTRDDLTTEEEGSESSSADEEHIDSDDEADELIQAFTNSKHEEE
ncbi:hypothetical protein A4A49_52982 [Nicotiana attenuata]|uniref:Zinc knuckle CX2CX4HX4C domain-containing protein n=1 Tax=Nicotiana attenuata TaxID=49451 RepID=A0A1J6KEH3_NICAT|nr:hypothetical protein A4A49_52982 [Nicotiana attenuata]